MWAVGIRKSKCLLPTLKPVNQGQKWQKCSDGETSLGDSLLMHLLSGRLAPTAGGGG